MKTILIIGDYNPFTINLIEKYNKEKWRVSFLTRRDGSKKPPTVFEQYTFQYTSSSIKDAINSARPELIIFAGAFDTSFSWQDLDIGEISNDYIASLNNILTYVGELNVRTFIYMSSDSIFEREYVVDITEDFTPHPKEVKNISILRGENMVRDMNSIADIRGTVIRVAGMYGIPKTSAMCNNTISNFCIDALNKRRIFVNSKKKISAIYVRDVCEALYLMTEKGERIYDLYHISSMDEITESELAYLIKDNCKYPIEIVDRTIGIEQRVILSNERFKNEFSLEIRNTYLEIVPKIIEFINKNKSLFMTNTIPLKNREKKDRIFKVIKKLIPFIEALITFIIIYIIDIQLYRFEYLQNLNLYLLYVLIFALIYGRQQGIFTSFLSVIGIISKPNSLMGSAYIYIVQILLIGLPVGHMKDSFYETRQDNERTILFLKEQLRDLLKINSKNTYIKDYYAEKIISSKESIGKIYSITTKLQDAKIGEVQFAALDTIIEFMDTKDVAIYYVSNKDYCRLASASSRKASSLGKTIEINKHSELFDEIKKGSVFINKFFDSSLPMMANALFNENKEMIIVILVWTLPYDKMTLDNANLLNIIGALFYSYFVREANYIEALSYKRYIKDTKILQEEAFDEILKLYQKAREKGYGQSSIIEVKEQYKDIVSDSNHIYKLIRNTDYIGKRQRDVYEILLTNTNDDEVIFVKERLEREGFIVIN